MKTICICLLSCGLCGCTFKRSNAEQDVSTRYIIGFGTVTEKVSENSRDGKVVNATTYGMNVGNEGFSLGVNRTEVVLLPESNGLYIKLHPDADPEAISKILKLVNSAGPMIPSTN